MYTVKGTCQSRPECPYVFFFLEGRGSGRELEIRVLEVMKGFGPSYQEDEGLRLYEPFLV